MSPPTRALPAVAIVSPGSMGSAIGRLLLHGGATVATCVSDRSERTRALADSAGFSQKADYPSLVADVDILLSIVAPAGAQAVAREVAEAVGHAGTELCYVDCNALAPSTVIQIGHDLQAAGVTFVDASIIGPPPREDGCPRLYASGPRTEHLEALARAGLDVRIVGDRVGLASALKMAYAAITKGTTALGIYSLVSAQVNGVYAALKDELAGSRPELLDLMEGWVPPIPPKAHRFVAEMEELERTLVEAGLPGGTFAGIAALYGWVDERRGPTASDAAPTMDAVVEQLTTWLPTDHQPPDAR